MNRRLPENEGSKPVILAGNHLAEDVLELYSLGKLSSGEDLATVEEHLLVCPRCQARQERMDTFVHSAKTAAKAIPPDFKRTNPKLMLPFAIAAAIATVFFLPRALRNDASAVDIALTSLRSEAATAAPADRPLRVKLDRTGLPAEALNYEVATLNGGAIMSGELAPNETKLTLAPLTAGQYWVRLKSKSSQQSLREFSLLVR